eukprot:452545_1
MFSLAYFRGKKLIMSRNAKFVICFLVQYFAITLFLYFYDMYGRREKEKTRPQYIHTPYFPSWSHFRFSILYFWLTITIITFITITPHNNKMLFTYIAPICWSMIFIIDWCITMNSAAVFLRLKYRKQKNPKGKILLYLGSTLLLFNYVIIVLNLLDIISNSHISYSLLFFVHILLYFVLSLFQEYIYFTSAFVLVFDMDSSMTSAYGFLDSFVRPLFCGVYCIVKYFVIIFVLIISILDYINSGYSTHIYQYALPFLLEIWFLALFYTIRRNRPKPCVSLELKCWRPFVMIFWNIASERYIKRNPKNGTPIPDWRNIGNTKTNLKPKGNTNKTQQQKQNNEML